MNGRNMALCGVLTALAVVVLLLGGAIGIGTFAAPVLAMAVLLPVLEECGARAAGDRLWGGNGPALLLVRTGSWRWCTRLRVVPILRPRSGRVSLPFAADGGAAGNRNAVILALYGLLLRIMGLTADLAGASRIMNAALLVLGNAVFLLLDAALARMTLLWRRKLRKKGFPLLNPLPYAKS